MNHNFNQFNLSSLPEYPLTQIRDEFLALVQEKVVILEAEPGAGKSTLAPLWVLVGVIKNQPNTQVILVQPRVLAAQSVAQRLAALLGEEVGQSVGYQVAFDTCVSESTRLLVVTPGILLQRFLSTPELDSVACVILDEVHERSLQQDLLWSLLCDLKQLRDDLQLVFMSATLDQQLIYKTKKLLNAESLFVAGRTFPVAISYCSPLNHLTFLSQRNVGFDKQEKIDAHLLRALQTIPHWSEKTILVFLSGWFEIETCAKAIANQFPQHLVLRLHSRVGRAEQAKVLNPALGPRIILSTNLAETSITIPDVNCVIDSGWANKVDYEQKTGLSRLKKTRISQASAAQRSGRAGRTQVGEAIRLWSKDLNLVASDLPEIRNTDLLDLCLRVRHWGVSVNQLEWLETPNALAILETENLLQRLNLLNADKQLTSLGKEAIHLGAQVRVAAFLLDKKNNLSELDLLIALALHFDFNIERTLFSIDDLLPMLGEELKQNSQWKIQRKRWGKYFNTVFNSPTDFNKTSQALARVFPERIGCRQNSGKYKLNSGISVNEWGSAAHSASSAEWMVFPWLKALTGENGGLGFSLLLDDVAKRKLAQEEDRLIYKSGNWQLLREWKMGGLLIDSQMVVVDERDLADYLLPFLQIKIQERGLKSLMGVGAYQWVERARMAAQYELNNFAESLFMNKESNLVNKESRAEILESLSDEALRINLKQWLSPFLNSQTPEEELPWVSAIEYYLGPQVCECLKNEMPEKIRLPSDRWATISYEITTDAATQASDTFGKPCGFASISGKLQEFFGASEILIAKGRIPLKIHLLSPNGSPLAITQNLTSFWQNAYKEVRKEMRGRYPRHPWPEDPVNHQATHLTNRKLAEQKKST